MNNNDLNMNSVNNGDIKKIYLENKEDNHYKFYIISKSKDRPTEFLAQWGRIGTKPQSKIYPYSKKLPWDQLQEKLRKGYTVISSDLFSNIVEKSENEALEYLKSLGIDIDDLDDILL